MSRRLVWLRVLTLVEPARLGHEVGLITAAYRRPRVLDLANWTTVDGVNGARSAPPGRVRAADVLWRAAGFAGKTAWLVDAGMVLVVPAAAVVLAAVAAARRVAWQRLGWRENRADDLEAWRTVKGPAPLR